MTGGRAGPPPRTDRSARAAGVAAVALLVLAVLLYGPWPIPIDRILPVSLPRHFWFLLAIILSVGALACLSIWEQGMPRHARPAYQRSSRAAPWGRTETLFESVAGPAALEPFPAAPVSAANAASQTTPPAGAPAAPASSQIPEGDAGPGPRRAGEGLPGGLRRRRGLRGPAPLRGRAVHRSPAPHAELGDEPPRAGAHPSPAHQPQADRGRGGG